MVHEQKWTYQGLSGRVVDQSGRTLTADDVSDEVLRFIAAAPDMALVALALKTRGEECLSSLPGHRSLDDIAAMDATIPVPVRILRDALAALRKAGVL